MLQICRTNWARNTMGNGFEIWWPNIWLIKSRHRPATTTVNNRSRMNRSNIVCNRADTEWTGPILVCGWRRECCRIRAAVNNSYTKLNPVYWDLQGNSAWNEPTKSTLLFVKIIAVCIWRSLLSSSGWRNYQECREGGQQLQPKWSEVTRVTTWLLW